MCSVILAVWFALSPVPSTQPKFGILPGEAVPEVILPNPQGPR